MLHYMKLMRDLRNLLEIACESARCAIVWGLDVVSKVPHTMATTSRLHTMVHHADSCASACSFVHMVAFRHVTVLLSTPATFKTLTAILNCLKVL